MIKIVAAFFAIAAVLQSVECQRVDLTLYYEGLDRGSKDFIVNQLYPTMLDLRDYLNPNLVIFGKTNVTEDYDGFMYFRCDNGPAECRTDKIQACAWNDLPLEESLPLIYCMSMSDDPLSVTEKCATYYKIDYNALRQCAYSARGDQYLAEMGVLTRTARPPLTDVPRVVLNGVWNGDVEQRALQDLKTVICAYLYPRPATCSSGKLFTNDLEDETRTANAL